VGAAWFQGTAWRRTRIVSSRIVLIAGGLVLFAGIALLYLRQEVLSPERFAERAANSLSSSATRDYVAQRITQDVLERADPQTVAARPLIESTIAELVGSPVFRPIMRGAASQLYGALATSGGGEAVLGLSDAAVLAVDALRGGQSGLKLTLSPDVRRAAIDLGSRSTTHTLISATGRIRTLGLALPPLGVALMVVGVLMAVRRRRAIGYAGLTIAVVGVLIAAGVPIGRFLIGRQVDGGTTRAAARDVWGAMFDDLAVWGLATAAIGVVLWLTAMGRLQGVPLPALCRRGWEWAARPPRGRGDALGRGVLLIGVAVLLAVAWRTALRLGVYALALALAVYGLDLLLGMLPPARARAAGQPSRWRTLSIGSPAVVGAIAAVTVAVMAVGIALGVRGPANYGPESVTACNGYAELCGRPVNEVAFAAAHNAMSAADQPNWYRAEHFTGIPTQLKRGIRGFLIDTWYGFPGKGGRVATDFSRVPPIARAKALGELSPEGVAAFERLRSTLGFKARGRSRPYLCHVYCEAGATDLVKALGWFRSFLQSHPGEVLILDIEDYITPQDTRQAFAESGLLPYVYWHPPGEGWPTVGALIESGQRVIVMAEHRTGGIPWYLPAYQGYLEETPYRYLSPKAVEAPGSCRPNRGGVGRPFFLLNNWVESSVPNPDTAGKVNDFSTLLARAERCEARRGHIPNLVAVDFYGRGSVLGVVNVLNGLPRDDRPAARR
jgi:hypothetical protein